jgi:hypothetical protein
LLENNQARTLGLLSHYLGLTLFELGELSEATKWVDSALSCAERTGNGLHAAKRTALLGAVRASRGHLEQAERCFADAEAKLVGTPPWAEVARVQRGHLHLSRARRARGAGDVGLAAQERTLAEGCLRVADGPTRASSDDLRIVARILERALLEDARGDEPEAPPPTAVLRLGEGLSWFSLTGGERVDLSRRPVIRSLLGALAEHHEAHPGTMMEREALIARAWPGEHYAPQAHMNRLHVALSTLRSLGLRGLLERSERGYRLDPRVELLRAASE